jgi:predicted permease
MRRETRIAGIRRLFRLPGTLASVEPDIDDEIRFHLDQRTADLVARGHPIATAREIAAREYGDMDESRTELAALDRRRLERERRADAWDSLRQDLRCGIRTFGKQRGFATAVILTLSLGLGANTAIFSVVYGVLLRPLPYPEPDRIARVWETNRATAGDRTPVSPPTFIEWRSQSASFAALAAISDTRQAVSLPGEPEAIDGSEVSADFFRVLGVPVMLGRAITAADDTPGAPPVVVLSHELWQRRFGGDSSAAGRILVIDDRAHEVVGVMPGGFDYPSGSRYWTPLMPRIADARTVRGARILDVVGRLQRGVTREQATGELDAVLHRAALSDADASGYGAAVMPLHETMVGGARLRLLLLLGAVGLLLLVACSNVANLLLVRASARRRELAVRAAIGATRGRLIRQLLTESLVLSAVSAVAGSGLAAVMTRLLVRFAPRLPRSAEIELDLPVFLFALGLALITGIVFGSIPALRATRGNASGALEGAGSGIVGARGRQRTTDTLVVAEVALALVLMVGASLLLRSFANLAAVDPGFAPDRVMTATVNLVDSRYPTATQQAAFFPELIRRLSAIPGVAAVGAVNNLPLTGRTMTSPARIEGRSPAQTPAAMVQAGRATPDYFRAMGIALVAGRSFADADGAGAPPVAIVNESFARRFFPGERALGRRARLLFGPEMREIVGIVRDVHHAGAAIEAPPALYVPFAQQPSASLAVVIRSSLPDAALAAIVRREVHALDARQPIDRVATMNTLVSASVAEPKFYTSLVSAFAALALFLVGIGVYAVMAAAAQLRRQEIGLRLALGSTRSGVVRLVLAGIAPLVATGLVLGTAGALAATRVVRSMLFEISPTDPRAFILGASVTILAALVATLLPAVGAARVNPVIALRSE